MSNKSPANQVLTSGDTTEPLYQETRESFCNNLMRAMRVGAETLEGSPDKLSQQALATEAGLQRTTINKYLNDATSTNPDLESICRLAHALNLPPALLLMRRDDWIRLSSAVFSLWTAWQDQKTQEILGDLNHTDPIDTAKTAKRLADRFGLSCSAPPEGSGRSRAAIEKQRNRFNLGIRTTTALVPPRRFTNEGHQHFLLALCTHLGATTEVSSPLSKSSD